MKNLQSKNKRKIKKIKRRRKIKKRKKKRKRKSRKLKRSHKMKMMEDHQVILVRIVVKKISFQTKKILKMLTLTQN